MTWSTFLGNLGIIHTQWWCEQPSTYGHAINEQLDDAINEIEVGQSSESTQQPVDTDEEGEENESQPRTDYIQSLEPT